MQRYFYVVKLESKSELRKKLSAILGTVNSLPRNKIKKKQNVKQNYLKFVRQERVSNFEDSNIKFVMTYIS